MQTAKKVWSVVSTVLVALVVICAVFLMGTRLLGFQVYTVITGSMEPDLSIGDLIYVKPVDSIQDLRVGDDVTFVLNEDLVVATHRVIRVDVEKQHVYTKGIANEIEDEPVHFKNVIGIVQFNIPLLGYVSDYIQNPPGMYIAIAAGAVMILLVFLPDLLPKKKENTEPTVQEQVVQDENDRLREQLEELKAQLQAQQNQPQEPQPPEGE
jgi:signal peptidase